MRTPRSAVLVATLVVLFVVVGLSEEALAYVDLGTGSYMTQLLTAAAVGVIIASRSLIARLRAPGTRSKAEPPS